MSDPLQDETQDSLACLSSAAQLSSVRPPRPQPTVDGCAAPTPQRASDEPLFFSPDTAGDPQHVAAAAPTEVERRTSESPSSASTGSLVDFLISDDDDAPNDGTQGSGAAPSPQQQQQRPPAAAVPGAAVRPPREAEPASPLHSVLQQIRADTGDGLGSDDDDPDAGRQNPLAPLPASVAAPAPRPAAPSTGAAVPAGGAAEAQRQSSTFAGSMPTGQVHQVFRSHWSRQDDERKAFRFAIDAALTPAQLRRKHRLINADNWVPPGIETDVRGQRIGVIMPPSSAAPAAAPAEDEGFANVPEQHPDDVLLPDVLVPASNADGSVAPPPEASRPTLRSHQIDGIRFLWDRLIDLPRDPASGQLQAQTAGCILAHSMGLGKTCQVLSFIFLFHRHANPNARVLLFVPKSTIVSWGTEINKWQGYYYPSARGMSVQSSTRVGLRPPRLHVFDDAMKRDQRLSKLKQLQLGLDVDDSAAQEAAAGIYILSYEGAATLTMRTATSHTGGGGDSLVPATNSGPEVVDAAAVHCDLIVCDEAHRLKSDKRVDTRMIRAMNTRRRLLLTGTPLQNHLTEYYCMINVAMPNFFPRKMFKEFFARPIARSMTKHADQRTIDHARQRTFTLIREVDPFVQRRDANVLTRELPRLLEFVVVVKLSPMQSRLYDELLSIMRKQGKKINLLQGFSYAAKLCAHPQILFNAYSRLSLAALAARGTTTATSLSAAVPITLDDDGTGVVPLTLGSDSEDEGTDDESPAKTAQANKKRSRMAIAAGGGGPERAATTSKVAPAKSTDEATHTRLARLCEPPRGYEPKSDDSAKMQLALELIRHCVIHLKEKVLLFSMSTVLLDFVQDLLDHASGVPGHAALGGYLRIDGSSSSATRKEHIEAFQNPDEELRVDPEAQRKHSIFLLSTKAGGVGLTLTAATRIIILDCSWNPADDRQAIGRAYRYGQTRPVFVYRLVCSGTIEHRVFDQKVAKEWLFQTVVDSEVVKRDNLKGAKLQNFLFRRDDEDSRSTIKADAVRDTERCCRADPVLGAMRGHVLSATTHNTMLEEDEAEYGAAEEQFYAEYKKRGGFLANAGETADTPTKTSVDAWQRQTERALEQQSTSLAQVLQTMINRRAEDAIRNGALNQAQVAAAAASPTTGSAGTGTSLAGGAPRHNFSMALAQLLDANAPHRSGASGAGLLPTTSRYASSVRLHNQPPLPPAPVVGPGSSRDDALSIDDDEGGTAPSPARAQRPPQPVSAAAPDDGDDDDDVIVVD